MVKEKEIERRENSSVKLSVTVGQESLKSEYDSLLSKYSRDAQIKGFRRGHVPAAILERKFGESIRFEASQKVLEESLKEVFDEIDEKPIAYSQPALDGELEFDLEKDFTYAVTYDIYPTIELGEYKGLQIEVPQVAVTAEDEERELTALQEQNAIVMEKDEGEVEAGNIVTVDYCEVDENDGEVEDTKREDFVFTQGSGYNAYKIDDDVLGMKKDDEKLVDKEYPDDFEDSDLAGTKKRIRITVKAIKERQLPEVDDDLAQDISDKYETIADLKADIRKRLDDTLEGRIRSIKVSELVDKIVEGSTIPVPQSMISAELDSSWRNFVAQFRAEEEQVLAMLQAQERTKEGLLDEWKPSAEKRLRGQLAVQELLEKEEIDATDEEVDAELERQAEASSATLEQTKEYYSTNNMMDYVRREVRERKLFDALLEESKVKKGKKLSFLDLLQQNQ